VENQKELLSRTVRRMRRYFAPEAAAEIWTEFEPGLRAIHTPESQEVQQRPLHAVLCPASTAPAPSCFHPRPDGAEKRRHSNK
jgi:hypothetical protein